MSNNPIDNQLNHILSVSPAIIYACRASGDFGATFVSDNITSHFGYSVQECLDNPAFWRENIHPDDCIRVLEGFDALFADGYLTHEYRFQKKDSSYIWVLDHLRLIRDSEGVPVEFIGSWLDITEQKKTESALQEKEVLFRDFFQINPAPTIITSPSGKVHMVNPAFTRITGYSTADITGKTVQELGFWDNPADRVRMIAILKERGFVDNLAGNYFNKDRRPMNCLVSSRTVNFEGEVSVLSVVIDITEQKKAEEALLEIDKLKSEFVATAAHELRTPLTTIMGFTELLSDQALISCYSEEQKSEFLHHINTSCERLNMTVDNLLDVSRIESGQKLPLDKKNHSIKILLENIVKRFRLKISHQIILEVNPGIPEKLVFDAHRIDQVIENLLVNAIKFSLKESTIKILAERIGDQCKITVIDQGIGMTDEQKSQIFDRFYRADASDTAIEGVGLGMCIVKQTVEDHGGKIWVDSALGDGTQIYFTLPI